MPHFDWLHLTLTVVFLFMCWRWLRTRGLLRHERDACSNLRNLVREMQGDRRR